MHVSKLRSHGVVWDHGHVFDAERLEDMLVEIIIQTLASGAFNCDAGPVNAGLWMSVDILSVDILSVRRMTYAVLPTFARLEEKRQCDNILNSTRELIYPRGETPISEPLIKESISETSSMG